MAVRYRDTAVRVLSRVLNSRLPQVQGTFREHSGNIQGTFSEHSGNTQGTFREHSVNTQGTLRERSGCVERTPVSPHPNCKKHFIKLPRLTQNKTCKGNIQGTFSMSSADACEPLSQLQEALNKSTEVDAEYNLPT